MSDNQRTPDEVTKTNQYNTGYNDAKAHGLAEVNEARKLGIAIAIEYFRTHTEALNAWLLTRAQIQEWITECASMLTRNDNSTNGDDVIAAMADARKSHREKDLRLPPESSGYPMPPCNEAKAGEYDVGKVPTPWNSSENGHGPSVLYRKGYKKGIAHFIEIAQKLNEKENKYSNLIVWLEAIRAKRSGRETDPYSARSGSPPDDYQELYNDGFDDAREYVLSEAKALLDADLCFYNFFSWAQVVATLTTDNERSETKIYKRIGTDWDRFNKKNEEGFLQLLPVVSSRIPEQATDPDPSPDEITVEEFERAKDSAANNWLQGKGKTYIGFNSSRNGQFGTAQLLRKIGRIYYRESTSHFDGENLKTQFDEITALIKKYNPICLAVDRSRISPMLWQSLKSHHSDIVVGVTNRGDDGLADKLIQAFKTDTIRVSRETHISITNQGSNCFWALALAVYADSVAVGDHLPGGRSVLGGETEGQTMTTHNSGTTTIAAPDDRGGQ